MYILKTDQFEVKTESNEALQAIINKFNIINVYVDNDILEEDFIKKVCYVYKNYEKNGKKYEDFRNFTKEVVYDIDKLPKLSKFKESSNPEPKQTTTKKVAKKRGSKSQTKKEE